MQLDHENLINLTVEGMLSKRIAVLGAPGSGKTNTVALLLEQLLPHMPFTIFDPHSEYYGLCEAFPIIIAGRSKQAHVPLTADNAAALARYSFEQRMPIILDMLLLKDDERFEVVAAYTQALWECAIAADVRQPYGIVIDEAHHFVPEGGKQDAAIKAVKRFVSDGRKFGFLLVFSTQRSAAISKAALALCELLFLHGVNIENDAKAYQSVLPCDLAETKRIAYALDTGECLFRQGRRMEQVRILKRATFHAGDTPTLESAAPPMLQTIDAALLEDLKAALKLPAATPSEAVVVREDTPETLEALAAEKTENERLRAKNLRLELDLKTAQNELKQAQDHAERLQARLNQKREKPTLPPVQETLIAAGTNERTVKRTTTTTIEEVEERHVSSLALVRQQNKQTKAFNRLLADLRALTELEASILLTLAGSSSVWTPELLARSLDCSADWAARLANKLVKTGLVVRPDGQARVYQGNVQHHLTQQYPALDASELFKRVVSVLK